MTHKVLHSERWENAPDVHLKEVDSTNELAKRWLKKELPPEGTMIRADHQTAGKGQRGRTWKDQYGSSLLVSFITYPHFLQPEKHFFLNAAFILSVGDAIDKLSQAGEVQFKWPNDLIWGDQKLGGILIEASLQDEAFKWCVTGLGLNVFEKAWGEIQDRISLEEIAENVPTLSKWSSEIKRSFEARYNQLREAYREDILELYNHRLWARNQEVGIYENGNWIGQGEVLYVNGYGELVVFINGRETTLQWGVHQIRKMHQPEKP